jgi:hypothetical protein
MKLLLTQLLTDTQGHTDEQALISLIGAGVFFGLEIYSVAFHGQPFDAFGFGAGIGTLLGATSAGFGLRARWTPVPGNDPNIDPMTGRFIGDPNVSNSP